MSGKIYWNLLILCGILCQGTLGTLSEKDIGESSDLLVRQKRVINQLPDQDRRQSIRTIPYIVLIREIRHDNHCPGTILSSNIIITVAKCVRLTNDKYRVYSGTSRLILNGPYRTHNIIDKKSLQGLHPYRNDDGISLIYVYPPIDFTQSASQSVFLYEGPLHQRTEVIVSGWGCNEGGNPGTAHPQNLRSITVPILSLQECARVYRGLFPITEADICTLDPSGQRYCAVNDAGAPLVIRINTMNYLVGIHLWNGGVVGRLNPDVFINLQNPRYKNWIRENMRIMEANAHHHSLHVHG